MTSLGGPVVKKFPSNTGDSSLTPGEGTKIPHATDNRRFDAFELWFWRRLLRVPWTVRRSNQSILKKINLEFSMEGLMLKLKLQYFVHLL